ncbi:hypothetical protein GBAR_LOCUS8709, partial [Geodia barretti]
PVSPFSLLTLCLFLFPCSLSPLSSFPPSLSRVAQADGESARLKKENEKLLSQMHQSRLGSRSDSNSHFFSSGVYSSPEPKQQAPSPTSKSSKQARKVGESIRNLFLPLACSHLLRMFIQ